MECRRNAFSNHAYDLNRIINWLRKIKESSCNQCQKKLTKESCYIYLREEKKIKKWEINKITQNDWLAGDVPILFCTESCFKQSIYYPQPKPKPKQSKKTKQNTSQQTQNQPQTTQSAQEDYTYCPQCPKKIKDSDKY